MIKKIILSAIAIWLLCCVPIGAHESISDLIIRVEIADDGSARVTELRKMNIDSSGTECYISLKHLDGMEVTDISVQDSITGQYATLEPWDVNASRSDKTGKCGLLKTDDGYELCWGKGEPGYHSYIVSYTLRGLVRHFSDADGMNYMFLTRHSIPIHQAYVYIMLADGRPLTVEECAVWGFGYRGDCRVTAGKIAVQPDDDYSSDQTIIVMARFNHGLLHPTESDPGTFEEMKQLALADSDYTPIDEDEKEIGLLEYIIIAIFGLLIWTGFAFACKWVMLLLRQLWDLVTFGPQRRRSKQLRYIEKDVPYWRDLPHEGCITTCNYLLNSTESLRPSPSSTEAINAYILRLIGRGCLGINSQQQLTVRQWKEGESTTTDKHHERGIYDILLNASGSDKTLQPNELSSYLNEHSDSLSPLNDLEKGKYASLNDYEVSYQPDAQLMGFRRYLKDFSIIGERGAMEVILWREYLVFATLLGIADQVKADMQKLCPEYFKADVSMRTLFESAVQPSAFASVISERVRYEYRRSEEFKAQKLASRTSRLSSVMRSRYEGRGGRSSFSGGSGHRGGGTSGTR